MKFLYKLPHLFLPDTIGKQESGLMESLRMTEVEDLVRKGSLTPVIHQEEMYVAALLKDGLYLVPISTWTAGGYTGAGYGNRITGRSHDEDGKLISVESQRGPIVVTGYCLDEDREKVQLCSLAEFYEHAELHYQFEGTGKWVATIDLP